MLEDRCQQGAGCRVQGTEEGRIAFTGCFLSLTDRGQALMELAIFGSFFLLLMGALLSYGLNYNYQQRAQQTVFRRALKIASDPERGSGSAMMMEERSIPDPMSLFGAGTTKAISASASVKRDYQMHAQAADVESLQGGIMDIQTRRDETTGSQEWVRRSYKTAGFRIENDVPEDSLSKYDIVYGSLLARKSDGSWVSTKSGDVEKYCISEITETDIDGNVITRCTGHAFSAIRIIDHCSGEQVDFDTCYGQSRMLVDAEFCVKKCEMAKVPGSETDCNVECGKLTNPPNQSVRTYDDSLGGAWYAADYSCVNKSTNLPMACGSIDYAKRQYIFPHLDTMFGFAASNVKKNMGMQKVDSTRVVRDTSMQRDETSTYITTTESARWQDTSGSTFVHQDNLAPDGYERRHATPAEYINVVTEPVQTEITGSHNQTVRTEK